MTTLSFGFFQGYNILMNKQKSTLEKNPANNVVFHNEAAWDQQALSQNDCSVPVSSEIVERAKQAQ